MIIAGQKNVRRPDRGRKAGGPEGSKVSGLKMKIILTVGLAVITLKPAWSLPVFCLPPLKSISVEQAVRVACDRSPLLRQSMIDLDRSKLMLEGAKSLYAPVVSLSLAVFKDVLNPSPVRVVPNINLEYDLLAFIKNKYNVQYYQKLSEASATDLEYKKSLMILSLYQDFVNCHFLVQVTNVLAEERTVLETAAAILQVQAKHGLILPSAAKEEAVLLDRCRALLSASNRELRGLVARINFIIGDGDFYFPQKIVFDPKAIPGFAYKDFAEALAAHQVRAAESLFRGARLPLLPSIQVSSYSVFPFNKEIDFLASYWIAMSLNYPIFNRGEHRRNEQLARLNVDQARFDYENLQKSRALELTQAQENIDQLHLQVQSLDLQVETLEQKLREAAVLPGEVSLFDEPRTRLKLELLERRKDRIALSHQMSIAQLDLISKKFFPLKGSER